MKIDLKTSSALKALQPSNVAAYLRSRNWREAVDVPGKSSIWTLREDSEGEYEILLPLSSSLRDFAFRMREALETLEAVEHRPQLEIYNDILNASSDVIRVHAIHPDAADGSIPLSDGIEFSVNSFKLVEWAAAATVEPKRYFSGRTKLVTNYLKEATLQQTERGSYVIVIASPLQRGRFTITPPFERQAVETLARALLAVREAAANVAKSGFSTEMFIPSSELGTRSISKLPGFDAFDEAIERGVSGNLCKALSGMIAHTGNGDVRVTFSWSSVYQVSQDLPTEIVIPAEYGEILDKAGDLLRADQSIMGFTLQGRVTAFRREAAQGPGEVRVRALINDVWRSIKLTLEQNEYEAAVASHLSERQSISSVGDLIPEGRSLTLQNIQEFAVVD